MCFILLVSFDEYFLPDNIQEISKYLTLNECKSYSIFNHNLSEHMKQFYGLKKINFPKKN